MTKKASFKGPVTKWEKRWVTVGHMKLLKWVPLKTKRINQSLVGNRNKDGLTSRQTAATTNMETRLSRSKRAADRDRAKPDMSDEIQIMYLNSLPKTRRTVKKLDLLQKKQLQEAGIKDDDAAPSSADEKVTSRLPTRRTASNRNLKSPSIESNASDVDNDVADVNGITKSNEEIVKDDSLLSGKDEKDDDEKMSMDEEDDSKLEEEIDEDDKSDVEEEQDENDKLSDVEDEKDDDEKSGDEDDDENDDDEDTIANSIANPTPSLNDIMEDDDNKSLQTTTTTTTTTSNINPSEKMFEDSYDNVTEGLNAEDDTLFNNY